jgi:hypothetical protein
MAFGQGVIHAVSSLEPFLFLEEAMGRPPPFGKHPHAGLCSVTVPLCGDALKAWDNVHGELPLVEPGGLYALNTARGVYTPTTHAARACSKYCSCSNLPQWCMVQGTCGATKARRLSPRLCTARVGWTVAQLLRTRLKLVNSLL